VIVLMDLGGVLVEVASARRISQLSGGTLDEARAAALWARSPALAAFERGACAPEAFARAVVAELGLSVSPEDFLAAFAGFLTGLYPGARALLEELGRGPHPLACLTDTNPVQWDSLCRRTGVDGYFQAHFLSWRIGHTKPDPAAYRAVIDALGCPPDQIAYFDDNPANVAAGAWAGMLARRAVGVDGLRAQLEGLGLL
jgi:HAD superfamily hydrolase (TIGR01509 family)